MNLKYALSILGLILQLTRTFGQNIDSLEALLPSSSGAGKADLLYELAREYNQIDPKLGLRPAIEAYEISKALHDTVRVLKKGIFAGRATRRLGDLDSSIVILEEILPYSNKREHWDSRISILNALGITSIYQARYDSALSYYYDALNIAWQVSDTASITPLLNNIGLVYYKLKDYERALAKFIECRDLMDVGKITYDLDRCLMNIGLCYIAVGELAKAQDCIDKVVALATSEDMHMQADFALGLIQFDKNNSVVAENYFKRSHLGAEKLGDLRFQFDNIDNLCQIYLQRNELDKALKYLKIAEGLIAQGGSFKLELTNVYKRFYELYLKKRDFQFAATYQEKYIKLKDSVYNEELTNNLMKVEAEYLERENRARIAAQEQVLVLNQRIIRNQRLINLFIGGLAFCLVLLAIVLTRANQQKKVINNILSDRVRERTRALETNHESIMRATLETNLAVGKMCADIKSAVATIRGLCSISESDMSDLFARQCISKVVITAEKLGDSVQNLERVFQQDSSVEFNEIRPHLFQNDSATGI